MTVVGCRLTAGLGRNWEVCDMVLELTSKPMVHNPNATGVLRVNKFQCGKCGCQYEKPLGTETEQYRCTNLIRKVEQQ